MTMDDNEELFISTDLFEEIVNISFDTSLGFLLTIHNLLNLGLDMEAFDPEDTESLRNFHDAIVEKLSQFAMPVGDTDL